MVKKKVCIIAVSLAKGGLERSCANLSILLSDNGYDVHLVVLNDDVDYEYKGQLFNLGKYKTDNDTQLKRIQRFRRLRQYFRKQKFDYILDNRVGNNAGRELYYMFYIYGLRAKVVYVQHNSQIRLHFPKRSIITRVLVSGAYAFVGVSDYITRKFNEDYNTSKCLNIYNYAVPIISDASILPYNDYILYLGRIDNNHKNISLLLQSYKLSGLNHKLLIVGDGLDKEKLIGEAKNLSLSENIYFIPFTSSIYSFLSKAKFLVMTSRFEGFPMVLVEALSVGTPVLSVDCISGPSEIIRNRENGLLVENHNPKALAKAMIELYEDKDLYKKITENARESVEFLNVDRVMKQWSRLLI